MLPKIYDGSGQPAPTQVELRAGVLSAVFEHGTLRYLRLGDREILRGVYAAVRDHNWGTIPARLNDLSIDVRADTFYVRFTSDHQQGGIHFVWKGVITGRADGTIRFTFDGVSLTRFRRNRIGFCVLHPMTLAGAGCTLEHTDGHREESAFPEAIAPHQPFFDLRAMTHEVVPGLLAEVRMEGDGFETEDQRNWTDASYKTYCTPLGLPFPVDVAAGTEIHQSITVRLIGQSTSLRLSDGGLTLRLAPETARPLPPIGLGGSSSRGALTAAETERLKALRLAHLRHDVLFDANVETELQSAIEEARAIGCALELALHLGDAAEAELLQVQAIVAVQSVPIARWLILRRGAKSTPPELITLARHILGTSVSIVAGTNGYFTQLNRERPPTGQLDALVYSVNPQVHAFDNASLVETLPTQRATVESARVFAGNAKITVSPVTLKIRWNPDATAPDVPTPGTLPRPVDPRQMSLFGAAWTLGSLKWLSAADSLTYFETVGWLGVMEHEAGSPLPDQFPSTAGGVFLMYHVFADVSEFAGGEALDCVSSDSLRVDGLALRRGDALCVLVANYTQQRHTITLSGLSGTFAARSLDETSAESAVRTPDAYRAAPGTLLETVADRLKLELLPYAVLRLDRMG